MLRLTISLTHDVRPAADIVRDMVDDATRILNRADAPLSARK